MWYELFGGLRYLMYGVCRQLLFFMRSVVQRWVYRVQCQLRNLLPKFLWELFR